MPGLVWLSRRLDEEASTRRPRQGGLDKGGNTNIRQIGADKAHFITDGSRSVTVGLLDSGIEADHPDLVANVDASQSVSYTDKGVPNTSPTAWQPTTSFHGTHVAGTIGAARNGVGVIGVAPIVKLASVKVVDDGYIYPEYAICGFRGPTRACRSPTIPTSSTRTTCGAVQYRRAGQHRRAAADPAVLASPHAAGVLALLRGKHPELTATKAIQLLQSEADPLPCPTFYDSDLNGINDGTCQGGTNGYGFYGAGLIDALDAVTK